MFKFWKKKSRRAAEITISQAELRHVLAEALEGQRQKLAREFEVRVREQFSALLEPVRGILQSAGEAQGQALAAIEELRGELRTAAERLEGRIVAVERKTERGSASLARLEESAVAAGNELARQAARLERAEATLREAQRQGEERVAELARIHETELARLAVERENGELEKTLLAEQISAASRELETITRAVTQASATSLAARDEEPAAGGFAQRALRLASRPWRVIGRQLAVRRRALELQRAFAEHEKGLASLRRRLAALAGRAPESAAAAAGGNGSRFRPALPTPRAGGLAGRLGASGIAARPGEATS